MRFVYERYLRFIPLYLFLLMYLWKFISLFGGAGPRFYQFEESHGCRNTLIWHVTMLNNLIPFSSRDFCIEPSWYLANDLQFSVVCLILVKVFLNFKNRFLCVWWVVMLVAWVAQVVQIVNTEFSMSYFLTFNAYWTEIHPKPWNRLPAYLIGVWAGVKYYDYKHTEPDTVIKRSLTMVQHKDPVALVTFAAGCFLCFMMTCFNKILAEAEEPAKVHTGLFVLLGRPTYCLGLTLIMIPLLLRNALLTPLRDFMAHSFFAMPARLTFGVFLCHTIFIQFDTFDLETGFWAQGLMNQCFSYLAVSFMFSLFTYMFVEAPLANVLNEFIREEKLPESYAEPVKKGGMRRKVFGAEPTGSAGEQQPRRRKKKQRVRRPQAGDAEAGGGQTAINDSLNESLTSRATEDD